MTDGTFSFRWGIDCLDAGYLQIPNFMFRYYQEANVNRVEFLFIMHLASYKYETPSSKSYPSLPTIAKEMGLSRRHLQRLRASLEEKGHLTVTHIEGGSSVYDFSGFAKAVYYLWMNEP